MACCRRSLKPSARSRAHSARSRSRKWQSRHSRCTDCCGFLLLAHVHDLDSFGAIPLEGKVLRFAKRCGGSRCASLGQSGMPATIRTANERLRSRPRRVGLLAAFATVTSLCALATPARADAGPILAAVQAGLTGQEIASLTLTVG